MEIYSYVGCEPSRRSTALALKNAVARAAEYRPEPLNIRMYMRGFLLALGSCVSKFRFNVRFAAAFACVAAVPLSVAGIVHLVSSYTGPLPLESSSLAEKNQLDTIMAGFALGESDTADPDAAGDGTVAVPESLFRKPVTFSSYKVQSGDTIGGIAHKFGLSNMSTLIAVNDIDNVRQIGAGQKLRIPSIDGLLITVQRGNSLAGLSAKYNVSMEDLLDVNDLASQTLSIGQKLFIPGAHLDAERLHSALGDLFRKPLGVPYKLSSHFGWRADPFTGVRSYHTGLDMACAQGTPILASMSGRVAFVGYSNVFGNYVIINHPNGYQTLYGHMVKTLAVKGQHVSQGTRIGLVGTTGYSTGPHLHFTVYKNGRLVDPATVLK